MRINRNSRVSHRTPYNRNSKIHLAKTNIGSFFKRYIRALKKRNIRTIVFTVGSVFSFCRASHYPGRHFIWSKTS